MKCFGIVSSQLLLFQVCGIVGRAELLSAFFFLTSLRSYISLCHAKGKSFEGGGELNNSDELKTFKYLGVHQ